MANPFAPHGLQPVQNVGTTAYSAKTRLYYIESTDTLAYYIGDVVQIVPTGGANGSTVGGDANGVPAITGYAIGTPTITTTNLPVGVIVGFQVAPIGVNQGGMVPGNNVNLNVSYVPATKAFAYYAIVCDDPEAQFEIMGNNAAATTAALTIGMNAPFVVTAPATVQGPVSGTVLSVSGAAVTNTLPLKILSLPYRPNVDFTANTPFIVQWNVHQYRAPTPGTLGQ